MFLLGREILNYIFKAQDYSEDDWQFRNIKKKCDEIRNSGDFKKPLELALQCSHWG